MRRISIQADDTAATCPQCRRHYAVVTRRLTNVQTKRLKSGRTRYLLETADIYSGRRLQRVETQEGLRLTAGSLITLVWKGRRLVGLSDHSRNLWFNIDPRPSEFPGFAEFYEYIAVIISLCILMQVVRLLPAMQDLYDRYGVTVLVLAWSLAAGALLLPGALQTLADRLDRSHREATPALPAFDQNWDE